MKPNRRKVVVSDPIKRIGLNGGNSAREIVIQIAKALGFKIHEDDKGVSAYGGNSIRIADHCTYMQTWVDNGTWNAPTRLDVVIEDEPTEAVTQVRIGYDFNITEFVSQSNDIDPQKARMIAYDIRNTMNGNPYANNVRGERRNLVATHDNNPQQINCNTNMNKKLIRLTESDLHRIVKNVVNKMINENVSFIDGSGDCECPYCGNDLYKYIWDPQNIISVSDRYDHYGVDGFQLFRNAYYKCPYCGKGFYVRVRSSDNIFKKFI